MEGERLFHAATTLRTELNGERGDVCGRRSEGPWAVILVSVVLYEVEVNVFEWVGVSLEEWGLSSLDESNPVVLLRGGSERKERDGEPDA